MPRKARIDAPGALQHLIARGIERRKIFLDDTDRDDFLSRLGGILADTGIECYAWAQIPNHLHLLLRTGNAPIATAMRRLLTGYAVSFNRRHRRHGHLVQNRYKSILCEEDPYLLELVRYIHLNPLRASLVENLSGLERYPYSGQIKRDGDDFMCCWAQRGVTTVSLCHTRRELRESQDPGTGPSQPHRTRKWLKCPAHLFYIEPDNPMFLT